MSGIGEAGMFVNSDAELMELETNLRTIQRTDHDGYQVPSSKYGRQKNTSKSEGKLPAKMITANH